MPTTFTLEIDWDRDGSWSDETAYLRRVQTRTGFAQPGDAVAAAGRCDLTLDNTTGRYSPGNTEGPLYGNLLPRRPVKINATDGIITWVLFRGFIEDLAPDAGNWGSGRCTIRCVDGIALLARQRISIAHAESQAVDEAVAAIISGVYTPPDTAYSDNGDILTHVGRAWNPEHTTARDALRDIAAAVYGRVFVARDGTATLLTRTDLQDPSVSAAITIGEPILPPYSARVAATQPDHLIAYWPLWESAGSTVYDYSGNGRNVTASGVTWGQPGIGDDHTAPRFDGVNDHINDLSDVFGAGEFDGDLVTIMLWAKIDQVAAGSYLLRIDGGDGAGFIALLRSADTGYTRFTCGGKTASCGYPDGDWHCFVLVSDRAGNGVGAFVDGEQQGTWLTGQTEWTATTLSTLKDAIGSTGYNLYFPGCIAHVAMWDTALTAAEIAALAEV